MVEKGFTLLELLLVLVMLAVITGLAAPYFGTGLERAEAKAAAREIASALRRIRGEALAGNADTALTVNIQARTMTGSDGRRETLPARLGVELFTARSEQISDEEGNIRFYPDGSSTGGEITLSDARTEYHVQVEWLSGRVSIIEAKAE